MAPAGSANELKALRRRHDLEHQRILDQLAEDKAEREARKRGAGATSSGSAIAASSAGPLSADGTTVRLLVRTEDGALRASFSATSTLLDVRAWVDESHRVARIGEARPAPVPGGGGRILVPNEQTEQIRAGRENFERQTARMREEARALREAAGGDASGAGEAPAAGETAAASTTFFVTAGLPGEPRREFLTEESLRVSLREAGLVPQGTLLVRRVGGAAEPNTRGGAWLEEEGEGVEGEEEEGEGEGEEEEGEGEGVGVGEGEGEGEDMGEGEDHSDGAEGVDHAGTAPWALTWPAPQAPRDNVATLRSVAARGGGPFPIPRGGRAAGGGAADAGHVLGGPPPSGEAAVTTEARRRAAVEAFESRHRSSLHLEALPPAATPVAAPPAVSGEAARAPAAGFDPRRQAALAAALTRSQATPAPTTAAVPQAPPAPPTSPPVAPLAVRSAPSPAAAAALAAAEARTSAAAGGKAQASTCKARESVAARAARAAPLCHGLPSATAGAGCDAAARRDRLEAMRQERLHKEKEKEAIRARLAEDQRDRKVGAAAARLGRCDPTGGDASTSAAAAALQSALSVAASTGAGPSSSPPPPGPEITTSEVRVRCEDGSVLRRVFSADAPVRVVADLVAQSRPSAAGPFVLRVPFPRREFGTPSELDTTLRAAGLAPRGTLLVLGEASRGLVRRAAHENDETELGQQMVILQQLLAGMPVGGGGGPADEYEEMIEYASRMGEVTTGLSAGQIARLPTRTVCDDGPTEGAEAVDAPCCCICCYEHAAGDKLLILPCKHEFHLECLAPWLRSKRLCPLCKAAAAPPIAA